MPSNWRGRWRTVCPCAPTTATCCGATCACAHKACTHWAYRRIKALAASAARCNSLSPDSFSASNSAFNAAGMGVLAKARWHKRQPLDDAAGGAMSSSTPSTPSIEVPDIKPMHKNESVSATMCQVYRKRASAAPERQTIFHRKAWIRPVRMATPMQPCIQCGVFSNAV